MNKWAAAIRRWFFRRLPFGWQMKLAQTRGHQLTFPVPMSDPRSGRMFIPSEEELQRFKDEPPQGPSLYDLQQASWQRILNARLAEQQQQTKPQ